MRNKSVTKSSSGLSSWMDDFLLGMANKFNKTASDEGVEVEGQEVPDVQEEVLAEVNINDLEKVTWNDETFYVQFDSVGADVLNEFGNVVTSLKGVFSIADVDNALNGKQVVVSSVEDDEDEITKAVALLDEAEEVVANTNDTNDIDDEIAELDEEDEADHALDNETYDGYTSFKQAGEDIEETMVTAEEVVEAGEELEVEAEEDFIEAVASGFDTLEKKVAFLEEQLERIQQEYARTTEAPNLDLGVEVDEQKHYEEGNAAFQEQLNNENSKDLTTPQGRVELSHNHDEATVPSEIEQVVTETEVPVETKEVPVGETATEEVTKTTETSEPAVEEVPVEEPAEEKTEDNGATEDKVEEEKEEKEEPQIKTLSATASNIFKHAICPSCGEKELTLSKVASNMQGVYCKKCPSEYAVNTDTEVIYEFKG